jgi:hypothetical protein
LQHLARNLGVAWLIGSDQTNDLQAGKKEKSAECDKS